MDRAAKRNTTRARRAASAGPAKLPAVVVGAALLWAVGAPGCQLPAPPPAEGPRAVDDDYALAEDSELHVAATVRIAVGAVNHPPLAAGDGYTMAQYGTLRVDALHGVLANDRDPEGSGLRALLETQPGHGILSLADDGSFTYTPDESFHGEDGFTYRATDGVERSEAASVRIAVNAALTPIWLTAGYRHVCAGFAETGRIKCWGEDSTSGGAPMGVLGLGLTCRGDEPGEMGDSLPAIDFGTGRTVEVLAVGYEASCALLDNQRVKCWGRHGGELGLGDTRPRGMAPGEMGDDLPYVDLGTVTGLP